MANDKTNQHSPMDDTTREALRDALETYHMDTTAGGMDEDEAFNYFVGAIKAHIANNYVQCAQVSKDIAEIIGEDEDTIGAEGSEWLDEDINSRNKLRDEQRKRALSKGADVTGEDIEL